MAIRDGLSSLTPAEAAEAVGVGVQSIRRWCEWHAAHLSVSASPGPGVPRRLTPRDVEVLITVKDLRYQGLQTDAINGQLAGLTFAEIDTDANPPAPIAPQSTLALQDSATFTPALIVAVDDLETRLTLLEASVSEDKQSRRDTVQVFVLGFLAACGLFVLLLLLAVLFGGYR